MKAVAVLVTLVLFVILYTMQKKNMSFMVRILTATAMGAVLGLIFKGSTEYVAVFGKIYSNLLKAIVMPLLFFSIISTVSSFKSLGALGSMGSKTIGILSLHNVLGSITAIILATIMGLGFNSNVAMETTEKLEEVPPFSEVLVSFFPKNIVDHAANNKVVPFVVFCIIVGVAILLYDNKEEIKPFTDFIEAGNNLIAKLASMIISLTPYAVMTLLANQVGTLDLSFVTSLLALLAGVFIACLFHTFITSTALIALIARVNPFTFQRKFFPAWLTGFTTQSSLGSIPVNVKAQTKMGVPDEIASFSASIGTTFGMPGCAAIWPVMLAMFTIHALGIQYSASQYLLMIGLALVASLGTVGLPGTGTIQATALFASMGLPVEMILILSPIAGIADMGRTSTNVHSSGSTGFMVAALEKRLDKNAYNSKKELIEDVEVSSQQI
ncbi:MAG: dicarboxylate/amino acid:cation symporter [Finegoldia sp.]|nr:dicarboxylate/amino acid:cation symporter [Finegoldia sp.]